MRHLGAGASGGLPLPEAAFQIWVARQISNSEWLAKFQILNGSATDETRRTDADT
jgi:hypothetical protein